MSKFQYISLRDCPHEFIITIGSGVKRERTIVETIMNATFWPKSTDYELFFNLDFKQWLKKSKAGLSLIYVIHFDDINMTMEDLAVALQQMPSKGQARKNGWSGQIPHGYSEFKKKFHTFSILKLEK